MQAEGTRQKHVSRPAVEGALRSLRERLAELYDKHGPRVYRSLLVLLGDASEAEDALQSAFVELARRPETIERMEFPGAYLLATARNAALRGRRRDERRRGTEAARILVGRHPAMDPDEAGELERALQELPDEQRDVVVLKTFEEFTFQEIGTALRISPNTAASRYRYALAKLRDLLGGRDIAGAETFDHDRSPCHGH